MDSDPDEVCTKSMVPKKPGGTFASMGLSRMVIKAVERKGYKLATPIQRKCIPSIMTGRDVVAMARTGSGKSAAFLLPLIDKLKLRQPKMAIRALILSPTRELATQTYKFAREFTKFTNLVTKLIIGGESINKDFETVTSCPDIIIATPGRLAHVLVEMKQKLNDVEIVVFDEADRLFEPGFKEMEQVNEICQRLPDSKQTLLFSATMPQKLADFAKVGLKSPLFLRLDVESNLSETLKTIYLHCNINDKFAILIHLLKNFVKKEQMTVVFMQTKHHIEYAKNLLDNAKIESCYVYSSMDPEARKIHIDKFSKKVCRVMLVTDIAARGIDIPLLDVVINFNFPFKPKLFIHRVGRVARAGRFGTAISLVSHDETPYLHALHVFFGLGITTAADLKDPNVSSLESLPDKILGSVPQIILDEENDALKRWHEHNDELNAMVKVCDNAMKPYLKTREPPAHFSVKAAKDIHRKAIGAHPIFNLIGGSQLNAGELKTSCDDERSMLDRIKAYKPQATIFEVGHIKGNRRSDAFGVMQKKRQFHDKVVDKNSKSDPEYDEDLDEQHETVEEVKTSRQPQKTDDLVMMKGFEDSKFYIKYQPDDYAKEKGLELDKTSFDRDLKRATLDLVADDENDLKRQKHQMVWDRKRKKFIRADQMVSDEKKTKRIKTESGAYISASYQSGLFEKWKSKSKYEQKVDDSDDDSGREAADMSKNKSFKGKNRNNKFNNKSPGRGQDGVDKLRAKLKPFNKRNKEIKNPEEIFKQRNIQEKREAILRRKCENKAKRNNAKNNKSSNSNSKSKINSKSKQKPKHGSKGFRSKSKGQHSRSRSKSGFT